MDSSVYNFDESRNILDTDKENQDQKNLKDYIPVNNMTREHEQDIQSKEFSRSARDEYEYGPESINDPKI